MLEDNNFNKYIYRQQFLRTEETKDEKSINH